MRFRSGVFIITEDKHCPLYNVGEELTIDQGILTLPAAKPTCLTLANDFIQIVAAESSFEKVSQGAIERAKFECGGCTGLIRFEFKKDKGYATLQMKLLAAAERRDKLQGVQQFAGLLRSIETFSVLGDEDLFDLATLLELIEIPWQFPIVQKGDTGDRLFILLAGKAEVLDEKGIILAELNPGEVFGEMSLLSGEKVTTNIMAAEPCQLAIMNQKNFRHILSRFPALQVFFYKLMVTRITKMNLQRAAELASGMVGQLSDISMVELCQMINSGQKTGHLNIEFEDSRATILFNEGEIVEVNCEGKRGKEAFYAILSAENGRFNFIQGLSEKEKKLDVIGGFMGLLMEGMQHVDENRHT